MQNDMVLKDFLSTATKETFKLLLEGAPDGILLCDSQGIIQFVNEQTESIFGYKSEELIGQTIDMLVPDSIRSRHDQLRSSYNATPKKRPMGLGLNLHARKKDGSLIPVEISLSPAQMANQKCVLAIIRDVSELRQLTFDLKLNIEELKRSNAELEKFAYVASHDLQEPLRMISGYTQLLLKKYGNKIDKEAKDIIDFTIDGAKRMQNLINDLLLYSQFNSNRQTKTQVDLNMVIQQTLKNLTVSIQESQAKIEVDPLPNIFADSVQMVQLFQNLVGNAVKFRKKDTAPLVQIKSQTMAKGGLEYWQITVKDNGIGIKKDFYEKVFAIFQRLHSIETYPGTGIGLAICKKIVENHKGEIWIESTEGEGTTFHFTIPKKVE